MIFKNLVAEHMEYYILKFLIKNFVFQHTIEFYKYTLFLVI